MPIIAIWPNKVGVAENDVSKYAVFDRDSLPSGVLLSEDNLTVTTGSNTQGARSNMGVLSGAYYVEFTLTQNYNTIIGAGVEDSHTYINAVSPKSVSYVSDRFYIGNNAAFSNAGYRFKTGDVVGVALNRDTKMVIITINGGEHGRATIPSLTATDKIYFFVMDWVNGAGTVVTANFGQKPFKYQPPAGHNVGLF